MKDRSVLIVEDDYDLRITLEQALADAGWNVLTASNGARALDELRRGDKPCLVLLDLMMPVMSGWELRRIMLGDPALAEVPVAVLSGVIDSHSNLRPLRAVEILEKPVGLDAVVSVVERHC